MRTIGLSLICLFLCVSCTENTSTSTTITQPAQANDNTTTEKCYRCFKNYLRGFSLFDKGLEKATCNPDIVQDMEASGYRCVESSES